MVKHIQSIPKGYFNSLEIFQHHYQPLKILSHFPKLNNKELFIYKIRYNSRSEPLKLSVGSSFAAESIASFIIYLITLGSLLFY